MKVTEELPRHFSSDDLIYICAAQISKVDTHPLAPERSKRAPILHPPSSRLLHQGVGVQLCSISADNIDPLPSKLGSN
jgi:hypothetical protein